MDTTHEVEVLSGLRGRIDETRVAVRDGARTQMTKVETSMRANPMLWAGVAAGTGFGLGLIGRIAQWRHKQRHAMPDIVIIEATC